MVSYVFPIFNRFLILWRITSFLHQYSLSCVYSFPIIYYVLSPGGWFCTFFVCSARVVCDWERGVNVRSGRRQKSFARVCAKLFLWWILFHEIKIHDANEAKLKGLVKDLKATDCHIILLTKTIVLGQPHGILQ